MTLTKVVATNDRARKAGTMKIHLQRKLVFEPEPPELDDLDLSPFTHAVDIRVGVVPDEGGLGLTIIQEAPLPLEEIPILPGFHRISVQTPPPRTSPTH